MTEAQFWQIIEQSRFQTNGQIIEQSRSQRKACAVQTRQLQQLLIAQSAADIVAFQQIFADKLAEAYHWDVWGIAWIIGSGDTDDQFEYFCRWLVGQGKVRYEGVLADPQSIVEWFSPDDRGVECEELFYAGGEAYAIVTGERIPSVELSYPRSPMGTAWTAAAVVQRFPQVAQKFGVQTLMPNDE